jgi:hypothetical protein
LRTGRTGAPGGLRGGAIICPGGVLNADRVTRFVGVATLGGSLAAWMVVVVVVVAPEWGIVNSRVR